MDQMPAFIETKWCRRQLGPVICQPGTFYNKAAYDRVGGMDTTLQYGMDLDLWLRFASAEVPFIIIASYQASFRRHSQQKGHNYEYLRKCEIEEKLLCRRYRLAKRGSIRYVIARNLRRTFGVLSGAIVTSLAYRLAKRRTLLEYNSDYS
jgi:hypothetical protein